MGTRMEPVGRGFRNHGLAPSRYIQYSTNREPTRRHIQKGGHRREQRQRRARLEHRHYGPVGSWQGNCLAAIPTIGVPPHNAYARVEDARQPGFQSTPAPLTRLDV